MHWNIPNLLTWGRIALIPVFVLLFYLPQGWLHPQVINLWATVIFTVAAITDWLDGYLARRLRQQSRFGAFLDPVADKLMVAAALIVLVDLGRRMRLPPSSSSGARSPSRLCANGWPNSAAAARWPWPSSAS